MTRLSSSHILLLLMTLTLHGSAPFLLDAVDGPIKSGVQEVPLLAEPPIKLASFNIQVFGHTKFGHKDVVDILVQILARYDIVQVLEIRDSSQTVFEGLRQALNAYMIRYHGPSAIYEKVLSDRLGTTHSKEQYGFLYRTSSVKVIDTYQYPDPQQQFERPPFGVLLQCPSADIQEFALLANHLKPANAVSEMDSLARAFEDFQKHWNTTNIIIAGDFNADCNYLMLSDWNSIALRTDPRFTWLIEDGVDTTVSAETTCGYDRFVVGGGLSDSVVPGSVKVYKFDKDMGLNQTMALRVSDHYPVEMEIKGKPHVDVQKYLQSSICFTVKDVSPVASLNNIHNIYNTPSCAGTQYDVRVSSEGTQMDYVTAHLALSTPNDVISALTEFRSNCPGTVSGELLSMTYAYLRSAFLVTVPNDVYGLVYSIRKHVFDMSIKCKLQPPYICEIAVSSTVSG